jgi:hypothetical protein
MNGLSSGQRLKVSRDACDAGIANPLACQAEIRHRLKAFATEQFPDGRSILRWLRKC